MVTMPPKMVIGIRRALTVLHLRLRDKKNQMKKASSKDLRDIGNLRVCAPCKKKKKPPRRTGASARTSKAFGDNALIVLKSIFQLVCLEMKLRTCGV